VKFTEQELTAAVEAAARHTYAASRPPWRRGEADLAWEQAPAIEKFQHRSAAGEVLLPVLSALPERPTLGARPEFSEQEYAEAAEGVTRTLVDKRKPGSWDRLPARRRQALVGSTVALAKDAVQAMPVRLDPDDPRGFVVPDHL
jgi:hypothetical protein